MRAPEKNPEIRQQEPSLPLFESGLSVDSSSNAQCETGADVFSAQADLETSQGDVRHIAPDKAHARRNDPPNSHKAAASVSLVNLGRTKERIRWILGTFGPLTDYGIAIKHRHEPGTFPVSPSGLRTRRAWLVEHGFVKAVGTGKTKSGRQCSVWGLSGIGASV